MDLKTYNEKYKVATNSVPAVAVRQGRLVLFVMTGRKGNAGGSFKI